jgi:DNA topoisomerase II
MCALQKPKAKTVAKKAPAAKAPKAGAKKLLQSTLTSSKTASKKRAKPESDEEDSPSDVDPFGQDSLLSNTPPSSKKQKKAPAKKAGSSKPLQGIENDSMQLDDEPPQKSAASSKSATDKYQKLTHLQQIIKRPDTYIGSVERNTESMWGRLSSLRTVTRMPLTDRIVFNSETSQMEFRKVSFVPGLYKIFDEILVNAADNKQNDASMKSIKVVLDREKGEISVENDGAGIPVEIHAVS